MNGVQAIGATEAYWLACVKEMIREGTYVTAELCTTVWALPDKSKHGGPAAVLALADGELAALLSWHTWCVVVWKV
jgi:hypothetical protein